MKRILELTSVHSTLLLAMALYISITVAIVAIIDVNKQADMIGHQQETLMYVTGELINSELSMQEMKSDYEMIQELGK